MLKQKYIHFSTKRVLLHFVDAPYTRDLSPADLKLPLCTCQVSHLRDFTVPVAVQSTTKMLAARSSIALPTRSARGESSGTYWNIAAHSLVGQRT